KVSRPWTSGCGVCTSLLALALCSLAMIGKGAETKAAVTNSENSLASPGTLTALRFEISGALNQSTGAVLRLSGADAKRQIIVTAEFESGAVRDYTRRVSYQATPAGVVR